MNRNTTHAVVAIAMLAFCAFLATLPGAATHYIAIISGLSLAVAAHYFTLAATGAGAAAAMTANNGATGTAPAPVAAAAAATAMPAKQPTP